MKNVRALSMLAAAVGLVVLAGGSALGSTGPSSGYETIDGSGSSWSSIPLFQWARDIQPAGLTVNFNPAGSAQGRQDYIQGGLVDFAASDVPFRDGHDKLGGTAREVVPWGYSYLPVPAGGVAFPYHIFVPGPHGHLVRDLRLSGQTLMEIFTGKITNWDNPQITRDYGTQLPDLPITPVIRADGSGATYYFTRWMAHVFSRRWNTFCDQVHPGIVPPCGQTEFYPPFGNAKAEIGSISVLDYITSRLGNGAIGYDESTYPLITRWPVAELRNPAGNYVLPTAASLTTALARAVIDTNPRSPGYLQVNLDNLYTYKNPASYPLSYTSYLIVPRGGKPLPPFFNRAAGRSLSTFIVFALCTGQSQLPALGYAQLPLSLVQDGLQQAARIPGHGPIPSLAQCR